MICHRLGRAVLAAILIGGAGVGPLAAQQAATVRGTVTDSATGAPVVGAQVSVPGDGASTLTTDNGRYVLRVAPGERTVRVEHLAFEPGERRVTLAPGQALSLDITLTARALELAELVVVGYGQRHRLEVTSAVSSVQRQEIVDLPVASLDAALQGKASGVQVVQNAGNPGNALTVRVRGSSSISASNQPLYVVDGVPILQEDYSQLGMGGQDLSAITGLSPDDIESIDILKDASAAAIYGSRGSNGVVLIRTRRGQSGATRFEFSAYGGWQEAERRLDLLDASEYLEFMNESAENDGLGPNYYGTPGVSDRIRSDWQEAILRPAAVMNYSAAMSGGTEGLRYLISGSHFDQGGIVIGSQYARTSGRANLDFSASDRLDVEASVTLSREDNDRVAGDGSLYGVVTYAVAESPLAPVFRSTGGYSGPDDGLVYYNPVALALLNPTEVLTFRSVGSLKATLRPIERLRISGRAGFDLLTLRERQWQSPRVAGTYPASAGGVSKSGYTLATRYLGEGYADWEPLLPAAHRLTLTAGSSVEMNDWELNFIRGEGFSDESTHEVRNAAVITDHDGTYGEHNLVSVFSRFHYALHDRYFLSGSIRADGSSRFGPNARWGTFPAASLGWLVSGEPFLADGPFSLLRVRASAGETGNQEIGDYAYHGLYGTLSYGGTPAVAPSSLGNPDLRWETTREVDFGFDAGVLEDRVVLGFDVYSKVTKDLLLSRPITTTSGFGSVFANVGSIANRGVELTIETENVRPAARGDFRWTTALNVSRNRNEVLELYDDEPFNTGERSVNRVAVGQPLGAFHMLRFLGVDPATGDAVFEDADTTDWVIEGTDTLRITAADRQIVGSPHPDFFGGLTNQLSYGPVELRLFLTFSQGAEVFNAIRLFSDDGGYYLDNKFAGVLDRWQEPGDVTDVPRASYDGTSGAAEISSRFLEDGSYVRLQDVTFSLALPDRLIRGLGMSRARFFASGKNLYTFTGYSGYSPDVNSNGAGATASLGTDFYAYPLARTFTFGIKGEL